LQCGVDELEVWLVREKGSLVLPRKESWLQRWHNYIVAGGRAVEPIRLQRRLRNLALDVVTSEAAVVL